MRCSLESRALDALFALFATKATCFCKQVPRRPGSLLPIRPHDGLAGCKLLHYKVGFGVEGCSSFKKRSKKLADRSCITFAGAGGSFTGSGHTGRDWQPESTSAKISNDSILFPQRIGFAPFKSIGNGRLNFRHLVLAIAGGIGRCGAGVSLFLLRSIVAPAVDGPASTERGSGDDQAGGDLRGEGDHDR